MNMEKWINNHPDVKEFGATRFAYTRTDCTEYIMAERNWNGICRTMVYHYDCGNLVSINTQPASIPSVLSAFFGNIFAIEELHIIEK